MQFWTYLKQNYINSYHLALMLQFSVFQNHLNPDLLSDGLWMVDDMMKLSHSTMDKEYLYIWQLTISHI